MTRPIEELIRTIPDYPKPGIQFRDITTLLQNPAGFRRAVDLLVQPFAGSGINQVAGIEARGFILGGAVAHQLSAGFVAIRKKGKLPWQTRSVKYQLEYGTDEVEVHVDSIDVGDQVLLIDDLIATGGTACAATQLIREAGGTVVGASFVIDLPDLGGRKKLEDLGVPVLTLVDFAGE
jgi:adenine phosphoribosyltransferase